MPWVWDPVTGTGRRLTNSEWNLMYCTNGATLRAACRGEGLPVSGTNAQRGHRLVAAGLTHAEVIERYGWRARSSGFDARSQPANTTAAPHTPEGTQ